MSGDGQADSVMVDVVHEPGSSEGQAECSYNVDPTTQSERMLVFFSQALFI